MSCLFFHSKILDETLARRIVAYFLKTILRRSALINHNSLISSPSRPALIGFHLSFSQFRATDDVTLYDIFPRTLFIDANYGSYTNFWRLSSRCLIKGRFQQHIFHYSAFV